jgi:LysR family transcriptional regulator, glycine cleavage system transcriptional activator
MNALPHRPLAIGPLRAFAAVAQHLNFRAAGEQLHLTQPAISRQISGLEQELGAALFLRGTRKVELTSAGSTLLGVVKPWLEQLDGTVRQLRSAQRRQPVALTTFASMASLWLLPRLATFQQAHPEIDLRISADDHMADLDDPELDVAIRFCTARDAPAGSTLLFGECVAPVASPALLHKQRLRTAADLAQHTLLEEDDPKAGSRFQSWQPWLRDHAPGKLEPRGWIYLNYTYQQIQAALAGQGVALARLPLVHESLERGDLVEPFGALGRATSPFAYWLVRFTQRRERAPLLAFEHWLLDQAARTRLALGQGQASGLARHAPDEESGDGSGVVSGKPAQKAAPALPTQAATAPAKSRNAARPGLNSKP